MNVSVLVRAPGFESRISDYRERIEHLLDSQLPSGDTEPRSLHAAMRYATLGGGKRLRPLLCYASAEVLALEPSAVDAAACAVELIHAFSLIHDDLPAMDDDAVRRGRATVHKAFGEATAILAGDALQTLAFQVLARANRPDAERVTMLRILTEATGSLGMTGGQAMDLAAEGKRLDTHQLEELHRRKTGCLFGASVLMAWAASPRANDDEHTALDTFATRIGLAFQIRDDLLDVTGDEALIGKAHGADAEHGKSTFPALLGVRAAEQRCDALYADALCALQPLGDAAEPLRCMAGHLAHRDR